MPAKARDGSESPPESPTAAKKQKMSKKITVNVFGTKHTVDIPEACTLAQVSRAVQAAAMLRGQFELRGDKDEVLNDSSVAALGDGGAICAVFPPNKLVSLVKSIKSAADAAGKGDKVEVLKGATDEEIAALKADLFVPLPLELEELLRHANGVNFGCMAPAGKVCSTEEMLEIANYGDGSYTQQIFRSTGALPWMSVDCEFAFMALEVTDSCQYVWLVDLECGNASCSGTLENILEQVLAAYNNGDDVSQLKFDSPRRPFGRRFHGYFGGEEE